ncbi:MAG: methylmalonyl-CoA mutase family protein, partial [Candidatus Dormibacteraceae bacterium]
MAVDTSPPRRWEELALGVLRKSGALGQDATPEDAEEHLRTRLLDGISVRALYTDSGTAPDPGFPGQPPYLRGGPATGTAVSGWDLRQLHDDPDVAGT